MRNAKAKQAFNLRLPADGAYTETFTGNLTQIIRPHVWFFVISDCDAILNDPSRIKIEITMRNEAENHLSVEQMGLKNMYLILGIVFLLGFGANIWRLIRYFNREEEIQVTMVWLNVAIFFQFGSMIISYVNLSIFESNGKGLGAFDFIELALGILSQLTITCLLIIMADGWTIKYNDFPNADIYIPVVLIVAFLHLVLIGLGKVTDDSSYKFSEYEGIAGVALIILRLVMFTWFLLNAKHLFSLSKPNLSAQFVHKFTWISSLYFLSIPILVLTSKLFEVYIRGKLIIGGSIVVQILTFLYFTYLFNSKGQYYQISARSSGILPGGSKHHSY